MSTLKFRAWDKQCKEMHYDFQWVDSNYGTEDGVDWIIFRSDRQKLSSKPHPFENPYFKEQYKIMQSTGLFDRKGKEIFESDLLLVPDEYEENVVDGRGPRVEENHIATVEFQNASFGVSFTESLEYFGRGFYSFDRIQRDVMGEEFISKECEIIGNVHANPELLTDSTV